MPGSLLFTSGMAFPTSVLNCDSVIPVILLYDGLKLLTDVVLVGHFLDERTVVDSQDRAVYDLYSS